MLVSILSPAPPSISPSSNSSSVWLRLIPKTLSRPSFPSVHSSLSYIPELTPDRPWRPSFLLSLVCLSNLTSETWLTSDPSVRLSIKLFKNSKFRRLFIFPRLGFSKFSFFLSFLEDFSDLHPWVCVCFANHRRRQRVLAPPFIDSEEGGGCCWCLVHHRSRSSHKHTCFFYKFLKDDSWKKSVKEEDNTEKARDNPVN